jgi:hypothetical protein
MARRYTHRRRDVCSTEGCSGIEYNGGKCNRCWKASLPRCTFPDCGRPGTVLYTGLCDAHDLQRRQGRELVPIGTIPKARRFQQRYDGMEGMTEEEMAAEIEARKAQVLAERLERLRKSETAAIHSGPRTYKHRRPI